MFESLLGGIGATGADSVRTYVQSSENLLIVAEERL